MNEAGNLVRQLKPEILLLDLALHAFRDSMRCES